MSSALPDDDVAVTGPARGPDREDLIHVVPLFSERGNDFLEGRIDADDYYEESRKRAREETMILLQRRNAAGLRGHLVTRAAIVAVAAAAGGLLLAILSSDATLTVLVGLAAVNAALLALVTLKRSA